MKGLERILELQELDLSIDRLASRREELVRGDDVAAGRKRMEDLESQIGEIRLALDGVVQEDKRLDGEASAFESRIAAEERRLYDGSVANPKELQSIQAEIANLRSRKSRIEDEELERMERHEDLERRLPPLETDLEEARKRLAELEASVELEIEEIDRAAAQRRREREALVPEFDEELLELYEGLRTQKRGVGAAALEDGVCQGCHQRLSAMELDRLKRTEGVRRCEYCRRILVMR